MVFHTATESVHETHAQWNCSHKEFTSDARKAQLKRSSNCIHISSGLIFLTRRRLVLFPCLPVCNHPVLVLTCEVERDSTVEHGCVMTASLWCSEIHVCLRSGTPVDGHVPRPFLRLGTGSTET